MTAYDERLIRAGVLLAGERLDPGTAVLVSCDGERRSVSDDGGRDTTPPIAMWMLQVASSEEAVEWAKRCPARGGGVEVRRVVERSDTGAQHGAISGAQIPSRTTSSSASPATILIGPDPPATPRRPPSC